MLFRSDPAFYVGVKARVEIKNVRVCVTDERSRKLLAMMLRGVEARVEAAGDILDVGWVVVGDVREKEHLCNAMLLSCIGAKGGAQ